MTTRGKVSSLTIQYIAGFFDGEGCVNIYQMKKGVKKDRIGYELSASVHNTNVKIIDILKNQFGGYVNKRVRNNNRWKTAYDWKLSSSKAYEFLKQIEPHLILKKEQARIAIEFQNLKKSKEFRFRPSTPNEDEFYEICYQQMRLLNRKGKGDYYPQRLNEKALKREATVRTALKNAEMSRNNSSALQTQKDIATKGGYAVLNKYGKEHYKAMRSKVKKVTAR